MQIDNWVIFVFVAIILAATLIVSAVYFFKIHNKIDANASPEEGTINSWSGVMGWVVAGALILIGAVILIYVIFLKKDSIKNLGSSFSDSLGSFGSKSGKKFSALSMAARNIKIKQATYRWGLLALSLLIAGTLITNIVYYGNAIQDEFNVGHINNKAMLAFNIIGLILVVILTILYWRTTIPIVEAVGKTASEAVIAAGGTQSEAAEASALAQNSVANGISPGISVAAGITTATAENPGQTAAALSNAGATPEDSLNAALQNTNSVVGGTGILP
jgi:hypothetical protein